MSIKNAERERRGKSGTLLWKITHPTQKCPAQWKQFLSIGDNKTALVKFFAKEWSENHLTYGPKLANRQLLVTCGSSCLELRGVGDGAIL